MTFSTSHIDHSKHGWFFTRLDCQYIAKPSEKDHDLPGTRTPAFRDPYTLKFLYTSTIWGQMHPSALRKGGRLLVWWLFSMFWVGEWTHQTCFPFSIWLHHDIWLAIPMSVISIERTMDFMNQCWVFVDLSNSSPIFREHCALDYSFQRSICSVNVFIRGINAFSWQDLATKFWFFFSFSLVFFMNMNLVLSQLDLSPLTKNEYINK
jgi:hypothetical protein